MGYYQNALKFFQLMELKTIKKNPIKKLH